jgi:hypothetical protein
MTTPHTALLGLGLTASSWFVFGNLALSQMGPMAVVQKRARLGVRPALYAAPALPSQTRTLLMVAAAAFVAVPAWTFAAGTCSSPRSSLEYWS